MAESVTKLPVRETLEPSFTREWFENLHPEIDRFFVKIEATRRSGSYLNEPKAWKRNSLARHGCRGHGRRTYLMRKELCAIQQSETRYC